MSLVMTGIALGLVVSMPPGPNAILCVNLACGDLRRAVPLITSAAITDAAYSLLAASGVLFASHIDSELVAYLVPCFTICTAVLIWSPRWASPTKAASVAIFNPGTAAIWLSLSSVPTLRALSLSDVLVRSLPVALGTAAWFTFLAVAAAKLSYRLGPRQKVGMQKLLAVLLAAIGLLSLVPLLHY